MHLVCIHVYILGTCIHIIIHTHTCAHAYTHAHTHTHIQTHIQTHIRLCTTHNYIVFVLIGLLNGDLLLLLQDVCIQCVFAGLEWDGTSQSSDNSQSNSSQKTLYSPQCLLSALRTARKLTQAKQARTLLSNVKHPIIELTKGDNSGVC